MPAGAIVITWGNAHPGREGKGLEVFGQALELAERRVKDGSLTAHKEFLADRRAGGFQLLEGERSDLLDYLQSEEFQLVRKKAERTAEGVTVELYQGGDADAVQQAVGVYTTALTELGYL